MRRSSMVNAEDQTGVALLRAAESAPWVFFDRAGRTGPTSLTSLCLVGVVQTSSAFISWLSV